MDLSFCGEGLEFFWRRFNGSGVGKKVGKIGEGKELNDFGKRAGWRWCIL